MNNVIAKIWDKARMVHNVRFTNDEQENIKIMIQSSLYTYLGIILKGREQFEEEEILETSENSQTDIEKCVYYLSQRLRVFSDWLIQEMISGNLSVIFPASSREFAPTVLELLKDRAFQAAYNRMNGLSLVPRVAKYILDRANEILKIDYEPSDTDILYIDGITSSNSLASMEFSLPRTPQDGFTDPDEVKDLMLRQYQLTRIHSSTLGENCQWLGMFEDADLVLFTVSLTDYDQFTLDKNGFSTNKMLQSKRLFENIVTHPFFLPQKPPVNTQQV